MIYERAERMGRRASRPTIAGNLRRIGKTAGLADAQLDACLTDGDMAEALVARFQENAEADDITLDPVLHHRRREVRQHELRGVFGGASTRKLAEDSCTDRPVERGVQRRAVVEPQPNRERSGSRTVTPRGRRTASFSVVTSCAPAPVASPSSRASSAGVSGW